jgi:hypothetical protein
MKVVARAKLQDSRFDYRLEHNTAFLHRVAEARAALKRNAGVRLEDLDKKPTEPRKRAARR